jgi:hypothetical protein
MFGNIPKLNEEAHALALKAARASRRKLAAATVHRATKSTAGGPHARVARAK